MTTQPRPGRRRALRRSLRAALLVVVLVAVAAVWAWRDERDRAEVGRLAAGRVPANLSYGPIPLTAPGTRLEVTVTVGLRTLDGATRAPRGGRLLGVSWSGTADRVWASSPSPRQPEASALAVTVDGRRFAVSDDAARVTDHGAEVAFAVPFATLYREQGAEQPPRSSGPLTFGDGVVGAVRTEVASSRDPWLPDLGWAAPGHEWLIVHEATMGPRMLSGPAGRYDVEEGSGAVQLTSTKARLARPAVAGPPGPGRIRTATGAVLDVPIGDEVDLALRYTGKAAPDSGGTSVTIEHTELWTIPATADPGADQ